MTLYVPKSQRKERQISPEKAEKYLRFLEKVEVLERELATLPELSLLGGSYFPPLLGYPICILKELVKWAHSALKRGDVKQLRWLVDNEHIAEEIRLLQKVLKDLGHA